MKLLAQLTNIKINGAPSARKIAAYILENPLWVKTATVQALAQKTGVSQSAVTKLIRKIEPKGYSYFKVALSESFSHSSKPPQPQGSLNLDDPLPLLYDSLIEDTVKALRLTRSLCDIKTLEKSVTRLKNARRIFIHGSGASYLVAQDFFMKLIKLDFHVICNNDYHITLSAMASAEADDIILIISHSGLTAEALLLARRACDLGLHIMAVTADAESPLALMANALFCIAADEGITRTAAISSRTAQLSVLDMLFLGLIREDLDASLSKIDKARRLTGWQTKT
jgi:RpiR family murPQ operon transcriptional repressor